jgi:hypothetical protein
MQISPAIASNLTEAAAKSNEAGPGGMFVSPSPSPSIGNKGKKKQHKVRASQGSDVKLDNSTATTTMTTTTTKSTPPQGEMNIIDRLNKNEGFISIENPVMSRIDSADESEMQCYTMFGQAFDQKLPSKGEAIFVHKFGPTNNNNNNNNTTMTPRHSSLQLNEQHGSPNGSGDLSSSESDNDNHPDVVGAQKFGETVLNILDQASNWFHQTPSSESSQPDFISHYLPF